MLKTNNKIFTDEDSLDEVLKQEGSTRTKASASFKKKKTSI